MRMLIVGGGRMAASHAENFAKIDGVELVAVVEAVAERRKAFAATHGIAKTFSNVEDAIDWGEFDAAANVTPDAMHFQTTLPLVEAGKHVLCEKPLATNYDDARMMVRAAEAAGVINMVNLTYRNVAALQAARDLVNGGMIGTVRHVEASYLQSWLVQPAWGDWRTEDAWLWRLSKTYGSLGVLGDVGIHIFDFLSFATGLSFAELSCQLRTFHKAPGDRIGDYVLDANDSFAMTASMENGALAVVHASRFASGHLNDLHLRIHGEIGALQVTNSGDRGTLKMSVGTGLETATWADVEIAPTPTNYERFATAVRQNQHVQPDFSHAAALQKVIDCAVHSDESGARMAIAPR